MIILLAVILALCYAHFYNARNGHCERRGPMGVTSADLKLLVNFLNKAPAGGKESTLGKMYDGARQSTYARLRLGLGHFLARDGPTVLGEPLEPYKNLPDERERLVVRVADRVEKYGLAAQKYGLSIILEELNSHVEKPRYRMNINPKKVEPSKRPKFKPIIVRQEFSDPLWQAIGRLLENDGIYLVGQCPVCLKFFVKSRQWQKPCSRSVCRKTYDNQLAAERQADWRRRKRK
jgi:hypothetical protein